ncbi:MAG TPA: tetratricopeptide repeat protein [Candidatus Hydrogenedentes bacterium]|nr:tetratricopeptide repeat protein [Candidatus Hydrogenedentota bacterium]
MPPARATQWRAHALLIAVTVASFLPVLQADFLRYDDTLYVTDNPGVTQGLTFDGIRYAATEIVSSNWHPLTILSHQLDVTLFGLQPAGHHAVNLFFHVLNACLLFHVLTLMTGAWRRSLAVALLFAVHPLHVESVAWVSERKDVLSTFFMFLAMGAYTKFARGHGIAAFARTALWFALALLAKPMPVTLPFLFLLLDYWPLRRIDNEKRLTALVVEKIPLFVMSAAFSLLTYLVQQTTGATRSLEVAPFLPRVENAIVAYAAYLGKMLLPRDLAPNYPFVDHPIGTVLVCGLILLSLTALALWQARKRPYLFVGWFWYVGTLVPVIGLVQIGHQAMADRYTYTPLLGIFIAGIWFASEVLLIRLRAPRIWAIVGLAITISVLAPLTYMQCRYWRDSRTLFTHTLTVSPNSAVAHTVLGLVNTKELNHAAAVLHFERVQKLNPNQRDAAFNLGTALLKLGRHDEAIPWLKLATEQYDKPADAFANLGNVYLEKGDLAQAESNLLRAIELDENQVRARINLGIVAGMAGDNNRALEILAEAVRRAPNDADARHNYGFALLQSGRVAEGRRELDIASALQSGFKDAASYLVTINRKKP